MRFPLIAAAFLAALHVGAETAAAASTAALGQAPQPSVFGAFQVFFALIIVLGAIFACAWLLRRIGPGQTGGSAQMRVISGVMVGAKERVVIVEVRDTWLVLGVTPAEVSTLHTMPKPADADSAQPATLPFAERFASALKRRTQAAAPADGEVQP
ncbi:MAG: flagellar biosynthetic protein FliO [Burkholderiales bacterium]|nr:flagellar biosynthetic protein FliO [Burkholderiales bacterium]